VNTLEQGSYAEKIFELKCIEKSWECLKPISNQTRYDYLINRGNGFERVQVKGTTVRSNKLMVPIFKQQTNSKNKKVLFYKESEVDTFAIIDRDSKEVYLVKNDGRVTKQISLRVVPSKNNQIKNVVFASNYKV
jgi:hypothetical protein